MEQIMDEPIERTSCSQPATDPRSDDPAFGAEVCDAPDDPDDVGDDVGRDEPVPVLVAELDPCIECAGIHKGGYREEDACIRTVVVAEALPVLEPEAEMLLPTVLIVLHEEEDGIGWAAGVCASP